MTEEPYRWLEAIGNRREYVESQIRDGSPVFAVSLDDGIVLCGVGSGRSKVFEIFDRQALAGLGHPADLERLRQALIDAAHLEAYARAPEDVTLRRLAGFNLGPQLKTAFEQVFAPPFLVRLLLAELGNTADADALFKLHFDGTFTPVPGPVVVLAAEPAREAAVERWLTERLTSATPAREALLPLLAAWQHLTAGTPLPDSFAGASVATIAPGLGDRVVEAALLRRNTGRAARYEVLPPP